MTLIEKTLKSFDAKFPEQQRENTHYSDVAGEADCICFSCNSTQYRPKIKSFITQALQEQDRESRRGVLMDISKRLLGQIWNKNAFPAKVVSDYAKQHNIDLHEN